MNDERISLEGTITRVTFYARDTGYGIVQLKPDESQGKWGTVTVVGTMARPSEGLQVRVSGSWSHHPKYGRQLKVAEIQEVLPKNAEGIRQFLSGGLIKGVGPKTAEKIVQAFGEETIRVLENEPHRLKTIGGFSDKKVERLLEGWRQYRTIREVMMFLQSHGVSTAYAFRIFRHYGPGCVQILQENPYQLADDVWGIGFKLADRIASRMGITQEHPKRLRNGVLFVLQTIAMSEGHTCVCASDLLQTAQNLLGVDLLLLESAIEGMVRSGDIVRIQVDGQDGVALTSFFVVEQALFLALSKRKQNNGVDDRWTRRCRGWLASYRVKPLTCEQQEAVMVMASSRMSILTGGPGCGKTTTLHAFVQMMRQSGRRVLCCAPTGRASRRMEEVIGVTSSTIHRLLEFDPKRRTFGRNRECPLSGDCLIVDEVSMLDVELALALVQATPEHMQVIWVGDKDQLPSVGPGRFFGDMIDLGLSPVARLTEVFRQGQRSTIVQNAHRINTGEFPWLKKVGQSQDFWFIEKKTQEEVQATVREVVQSMVPSQLGVAPEEAKVLVPMHRGLIGTVKLNELLQDTLNGENKTGPALMGGGGRRFFVGDVVLQKVNNYQSNLMNGEVGVVVRIDPQNRQATLRFDDKQVVVEQEDLQDMDLGYAMSIHKSQGSEFPVVVLPLHESQYVMLHRTLLYTALTRARKLCVVVGTKRAIGIAIQRQALGRRKTLLPLFGQHPNGMFLDAR